MQHSPVNLELCLTKTRTGNQIIVVTLSRLRKDPRSKCFRPHENEMQAVSNSFRRFGLKSVFEMFRFHDGLAWTVGGLIVEIN